MNWNSDNIPSLKGRTVLITGGNSGIGFETAKMLSEKGAGLVLACRDESSALAARNGLMKGHPHAEIDILPIDLGNLRSIHDFAGKFKAKYSKLHVLINNAGIMMPPYQLTHDGFESQMGINHLGHFALTGLLLDTLLSTEHSRVVTISSNGHKFGNMDFSNPFFKDGKGYSRIKAYARSKLANLLFAYELHRRLKQKNHTAISVAAHPGVAVTNLDRFIKKMLLVKILMPIWKLTTQSAEMGALPGIRAAVDPEVQSGEYYGPDGVRSSKGYPVKIQSSEASYDESSAQELWRISEEATQVKYKI